MTKIKSTNQNNHSLIRPATTLTGQKWQKDVSSVGGFTGLSQKRS